MADRQHATALAQTVGAPLACPAPEQRRRAKHLAISSAHVVRSALKRAGDGKLEQLALCFERPRQHLTKWSTPDENRHPSTVDLAVGPTAVVVPILRWIASHHDHDVLRRPRIVHADDHLSRFSALCSAHNALLLALASYARGAGQASTVRELALAAAEACLETAAWAGSMEGKR